MDEHKAYSLTDYNSEHFTKPGSLLFSLQDRRLSYYAIIWLSFWIYLGEKESTPLTYSVSETQSGTQQPRGLGPWSMTSIFARVEPPFDRRYLFWRNYHRDGSSRFVRNKFGVFLLRQLEPTQGEFYEVVKNRISLIQILRFIHGLTQVMRISDYTNIRRRCRSRRQTVFSSGYHLKQSICWNISGWHPV